MEDEKVLGFIRSTVELAEERFGQRLGETEARLKNEIKAVRADMGKMEAGIRAEMGKMETGIRADMGKMEAGIKGEMALMEKRLTIEMDKREARLTENILGRREDIDAAFKDIFSLRKVDAAITKQVKSLEKAQ